MSERIATYDTWEERQQLCGEAEAAGEWMKHDVVRDGIKTLVFVPPTPDDVTYFQSLREPGHQLDTFEDNPLDMDAARDYHMGRIRLSRDQALAALDVPFMRAVETGDTAAQSTIGAEKQTLRDIPQTFDLSGAATPEALMALWPAELPSRG